MTGGDVFVHESAFVDDGARIGGGTKVWHFCHVLPGATIGANATIVCGATLGEYAFVGAGSVVTGDVAAYALVVGVPARRIGWMCQCGERLPDGGAGTCGACGAGYLSAGDGIVRTDER